MTIKRKPKTKPINAILLSSSMLGGISYVSWHNTSAETWQLGMLAVFTGASALVTGYRGVTLLWEDFQLRAIIKASEKTTDDHGDARFSTYEEREERGMHDLKTLIAGLVENVPTSIPIGSIFTAVLSPPGGGKTSRLSLIEAIHVALSGKSMLLIDVKCDMGPQLIPVLKMLGLDVIVINPAKKYEDVCGNTPINLYQPVIDAVHAEDDMRKDASKLANDHAAMHVPNLKDGASGDANFFNQGTQRCISTLILILALSDPGRCTPTQVYQLANSTKKFTKFLKDFYKNFEGIDPADPLIAYVKGEVENLLEHAKNAKADNHYLTTFLEGVSQACHVFNLSGHAANFGADAVRRISEMREKQVIVFVMAPLSHKREFAPLCAMINQAVLTACKYHPDGTPIHLLGEEVLAYDYRDILSDLETLREYGFTGTFYFQSLGGLKKKLGREGVEAFLAYCDTLLAFNISSPEESKFLSQLMAQETIKKGSFSSAAFAEKIDMSSGEMAKPLMSDAQIRRLPKSTGLMFCRGMHPTKFKLFPHGWGSIAPYCDWIPAHPILKTKLPRKPLFKLDYADLKMNEGKDGS